MNEPIKLPILSLCIKDGALPTKPYVFVFTYPLARRMNKYLRQIMNNSNTIVPFSLLLEIGKSPNFVTAKLVRQKVVAPAQIISSNLCTHTELQR
jgi:hypothetical protein